MTKKQKAKLESKARLKLRINKFLGECLREHNRLDIEQGKKFADEFPNVYSTIFGEELER
jgi:hypothetical protein